MLTDQTKQKVEHIAKQALPIGIALQAGLISTHNNPSDQMKSNIHQM